MKKIILMCLTVLFFPFGLLYMLVMLGGSVSKEIMEEIVYHKEIKAKRIKIKEQRKARHNKLNE